MALLQIRNEIIASIGGRSDVSSQIDDHINYAVSELATMYDFEELAITSTMTTIDTVAEYLLPSELYVLWNVKEETRRNKALIKKDIRLGYDSIDETKTGVPHNYAQFNKTLVLFGMVPNNNNGSNYSIRIRYWKRHSPLVDDGDATVFPAEWERGVRLKAQAFVFGFLDMEEKQAIKQKEFDRWVSRIKLPRAAAQEKAKTAGMNFGNR